MIGLNFDGYPMIWHNENDNPDIIKKDFLGDAMSVGVKAVEIRDVHFSAVKPKKKQNGEPKKAHPKIPRIQESDYDLLP